MTTMHRIGLVLLVVLVSRCTLLGPEDEPTVRITTDQATYRLEANEQIRASVKNTSTRTISYNQCMGLVLEEIEKGEVVNEFGFPVCECLCIQPLEPDSQIPSSVTTLSAEKILQYADDLQIEADRTYRLRFENIFQTDDHRNQLYVEQRRSNTFSLVKPDVDGQN